MKNFIQEGNAITLTAPSGGVVSGHIVVIASIFAVASITAAENEDFEGVTEGVFEFAKTSADTPAQGDVAYWDNTAKEVTTTSASNTEVGIFVKAYGNGDTLAQVRLKAQ